MKFITHNDQPSIVKQSDGTHLVGHIKSTYTDMIKIFDSSMRSKSQKSDFEWVIKFEDGTIAIIYNINSGRKNRGLPPIDMLIEWHVGGHDKKAFELVLSHFVVGLQQS